MRETNDKMIMVRGKTITRPDLERRWDGRHEKELSLEAWTAKYYADYEILDLPVPVLADDMSRFVTEESHVEARESTITIPKAEKPDSRGGQKPFDRKAYQREYMKKWRIKQKEG